MSLDCNTLRRQNGLPYPRTCCVCGVGPCNLSVPNPAASFAATTLTSAEMMWCIQNPDAVRQAMKGVYPDER